MSMKTLMFAGLAAAGLALAGCGGGGSSTPKMSGEPDPTPHVCEAGPSQACVDARQAELDALDPETATAKAYADARKAVMDAQDALDTAGRVTDQKKALADAAGMIDTSDLSDANAIAAARTAITALEAALNAADDVSDADKAMYQTRLAAARDAVATAQTGLDKMGRMMAQRTAITSAVTMATTAVNGVKNTSTDSEVSSAEQAIADLEAAIAGAEDLPEGDTDVASARGTVAALKTQLNTAKTARTAYLATKASDDMKAAAKLGKDLHGALAGNATADTTALDNATAALAATGLTVTAAAGAGAFEDTETPPVAILKASDAAVAALGSWAGTDYKHTDTGTKVVNEARVYNNKGPGKTVPLADAGITVHTGATAGDNIKGYYTVDETADLAKIMGAAFTHSGTKSHEYDDDKVVAFTTRGTFDGAPGTYRCDGSTTACSSTNDGEGSPSALAGVWHFKPDAGAMVHQPDANYLYYGWWVSKDKDGMPTAASAFAGVFGAIAGLTAGNAPDEITGSATYSGNAAGKFAMSNPLDGTGRGGHFTADANLTAKFGANTAPNNGGVSGTINNFRLNDGSEDAGWSVELKRAGWDSGADTFGGTGNEAMTVWSINGNKAPESGTWSGTMYDEMPGGAPDGDGSTVPTTVTGTFYSEFSTIGRMVGAFGANKQ